MALRFWKKKDTIEEGREERILQSCLKSAIGQVYRQRMGGEGLTALVERFERGLVVETSDVQAAPDFLSQLGRIPGLARIMQRLDLSEESPSTAAAAVEFALEGLHLTRRLNKHSTGPGAWSFEA